jgi:uncharacterized membrane protein (UPF0136 family)
MKMKANGIAYGILGFLVLIFGIFGFFTKGSIPSLAAGTLFGLSLLFCAYQTKSQKVHFESLGLIVTLILDISFALRLLKTKTFFPAGLFVLLTTVTIVLVALNIKRRSTRIVE